MTTYKLMLLQIYVGILVLETFKLTPPITVLHAEEVRAHCMNVIGLTVKDAE